MLQLQRQHFLLYPIRTRRQSFIAPVIRLYIAGIGVGGKGESDLTGFAKNPKAKIAFLCDVDDRQPLHPEVIPRRQILQRFPRHAR